MKTTLAFLIGATLIGGTALAATPTDNAFVAKVSQGGMFEVAAGKLAITRGSTQDIRDLATMEVHDHMLVGDELKRISMHEGVTFAGTLDAKFSTELAHLSSLHGRAFDAEYLSQMAALHDADGAAFAAESTAGGSADYRAFGAETHPIVQRHIGAIRAVPVR